MDDRSTTTVAAGAARRGAGRGGRPAPVVLAALLVLLALLAGAAPPPAAAAAPDAAAPDVAAPDAAPAVAEAATALPTKSASGPAGAPRASWGGDWFGGEVPDRYVVATQSRRDAAALIREHRGDLDVSRRHGKGFVGFTATMTPGLRDALSSDPRVEWIEADQLYGSFATQSSPPWGLDRIDQEARPLSGTYSYASKGAGVTVYVVDSGVLARHREFGTRVKRGYDTRGRKATKPCDGHGTHVAATIGGRRYGVAKRVKIIPVRLGPCGGAFSKSEFIDALEFVARHHRRGRPAALNLSLGGPASRAIDSAVRRLIDRGIVVVAAAGNEAYNACRVSPARVPLALTVGATDRADDVPFFSNYGRCLDLFAPGVKITSAWIRSRNDSRAITGTSMATPHVTGAVARYLARHPSASPRRVARAIKGDTIRGVLGGYPGSGSPDKLLHVPGRAPTALDVSLSPETFVGGEHVTIEGTLTNRRSGVPIGDKAVVIYQRAVGATAWRRVGDRITSRQGVISLPHTPGAATEYQLRHRATPTTARTRSRIARAEVDLRGASLTIALDASSISAGDSVTISGTLRRTADGAGMANEPVYLEVQRPGATTWVLEDEALTGSGGSVEFVHQPLRNAEYRLTHPDTSALRAAVSASEALVVSFRVVSTLDVASVGVYDPAVISGIVTPSPLGYGYGGDVELQYYDNEEGWTATNWAYPDDSGVFSFSVYEYEPGTYRYRVVADADDSNGRGVGPEHTLTVTCDPGDYYCY